MNKFKIVYEPKFKIVYEPIDFNDVYYAACRRRDVALGILGQESLDSETKTRCFPHLQNIIHLQHILDLLINKIKRIHLNFEVVIAGGCIRDVMMGGFGGLYESYHSLIKDFDVFILDFPHDISNNPYGRNYLFGEREFSSFALESDVSCTSCKELTRFFRNRKVQIIASSAKNPDELLSTFDIHACEFAYTGNELYFNGITDFFKNKISLNIDSVRNPLTTLRRMFYLQDKYFNRGSYGLSVDVFDVALLANMALWEQKKKKA